MRLIGNERYIHVGADTVDPGMGLFAGLNVVPKCTDLSTYSYGLDEVHSRNLQRAFVKRAMKLDLYDGRIINLDFHTVPHFGDESVLQTHWAGARGRRMKGALTLFMPIFPNTHGWNRGLFYCLFPPAIVVGIKP